MIIFQCPICKRIRRFGKWIECKNITFTPEAEIKKMICKNCADDCTGCESLIDLERRIDKLQFCEKGVAILFLIMCLVTAFCAVSHFIGK